MQNHPQITQIAQMLYSLRKLYLRNLCHLQIIKFYSVLVTV
jgi:hypothetical protein